MKRAPGKEPSKRWFRRSNWGGSARGCWAELRSDSDGPKRLRGICTPAASELELGMRRSVFWLRFAVLVLAAFAIWPTSAGAFPGVVVSTTKTPPSIGTTELVVMQHAGVSIVTLAFQYRGPFK